MAEARARRGRMLLPVLAVLAAWLADELARPDILLVGDVTIDIVGEEKPAGGSITYAAAALSAYGIRACIVTAAGPDADLSAFLDHELHVIKSTATLTFAHETHHGPHGHSRHLTVTANPSVTLTRAHVPRHCQRARAVLLGPLVLDDVDAASFLSYDSVWDRVRRWRQSVGLMAQGYQRRLAQGSTGEVLPLPTPSTRLLAGLGSSVSVFLSDVETDAWPAGEVGRVAAASARLLVTQGKKGAMEYNATGVHAMEAYPVDRVVDTNGAGDVFATGYMVAQLRGDADPGFAGNWAAGQAVRQPQACKPLCVGAHIRGAVRPWGWRDRLQGITRDVVSSGRDVAAELRGVAREVSTGGLPPLLQYVQQLPQRWSATPQPSTQQ